MAHIKIEEYGKEHCLVFHYVYPTRNHLNWNSTECVTWSVKYMISVLGINLKLFKKLIKKHECRIEYIVCDMILGKEENLILLQQELIPYEVMATLGEV